MDQTNPGGDEIRDLLRRIARGDEVARNLLFQLVYVELKRMAIGMMGKERGDHTLQPTALVNEAFLRLPLDGNNVQDRAHFLAVSSSAMRHVLVDHARARLSTKRGSGKKESLDDNLIYDQRRPADMLDLDRALNRLEALSPRQAQVVEMRFFGGLSEEEIAEALQVSSRTVKRDWQIARAWLYGELKSGGGDSPEDSGSGGSLVPVRPKGQPPAKRASAAASSGRPVGKQ